MQSRVTMAWMNLQATFWFKPGASAALALGLFIGLQVADGAMAHGFTLPGWLLVADLDAARQMLSAIVQAMLGVTGVTFSVTITALSLASSQYGPRLLRNFVADPGSQWVLGIFTGTVIYGLLAVRSLRQDEPIPSLTVNAGVILAFVSVGALVYFIHHVAVSIHADELTVVVARDLRRAALRMFPEVEEGASRTGAEPLEEHAGPSTLVKARRSGYVQTVDDHALLAVAVRAQVVIQLRVHPGSFVMTGSELAEVWPPERCDEPIARAIHRAVVIGKQRTPGQDVDFMVNELVEIALRALSPALNDPYVALACLDRLTESLSPVVERGPPRTLLRDESGMVRLRMTAVTFLAILQGAMDQLRGEGADNLMIVMRMMHMLGVLGENARWEEDRAALRLELERLRRAADRALVDEEDRARMHAVWKGQLARIT